MEGILKFWGLRWEHLWVKAEHYSHYYFKLIRTDTALDLSQKAQKQSHTTTLKKSFIFLEASRSLPYTTILRTTKFWVGGGEICEGFRFHLAVVSLIPSPELRDHSWWSLPRTLYSAWGWTQIGHMQDQCLTICTSYPANNNSWC